MESYELHIAPPPKKKNGQFPKGNAPFNKGVPMKTWMDGRKVKRVLGYLEIGRKLGNPGLPGANKKPVVAIKDGRLFAFCSGTDAAKILRARGIKINARNINHICHGKLVKIGKYSYTRKRAGGYQWFFADQPEKYSMLVYNSN